MHSTITDICRALITIMSLSTTTGIVEVNDASTSIHRSISPTPRPDSHRHESHGERDNVVVELSRLGQPVEPGSPPPAQTKKLRRKAELQFFTLCLSLFLVGWNDGTNGPLLPKIQSIYHVRI